ncbi:MAG: peptidyl-prolyl cis-trans isomerase, partial [Bacilli bacterium]|nr:peptidyl-prolyl cis-trans isomerase [Bacilli bacterium]
SVKQKYLACLLVGMIIGALAMTFCWPKRIAKLKNGEEVVATVGNYTVSADEVYSAIKNETAMMHILDMVDYSILVDMYGESSEADTYAKEQSELIYKNYEEFYGYTKDEFLAANGYKNEDVFIGYLNHDYYYSKYYDEYLLKLITDEELEKYYDESVSGKKIVHLYTKYDDSVDLNDIKKELDSGKSIAKVNEKYKGAMYNELGEITYADYAEYSDEFIKNLYSLKKGETSKVFEDGNSGESLIYVESVEEKPKFEDIKEDLKNVLAKKKDSEDDSIYYKAFIELREEKGLKFNDTEYKTMYEEFIKNYK